MKKIKLKILLILFLLITLISTISSASYNDIKMSIVEEPVCTINFGNKSFVERSIVSKNLADKEITFQIKITNNEDTLKPTGEMMLIIDNSNSMLNSVTSEKTREDLVIDSAKTLITNLLKENDKLKIGIVSFSSNTDISKEGTIEDAKLISELTNNTENLISAISNIKYDGPRTNLDAGITLAQQYFTNETDISHKYVIVLSDGVPNVAIDYDKNYYSDDVISKTKAKLKSLSNITNNVILMLTGISNGSDVATPSTKTYDEIINDIFGTATNPTIGKFYYITDDKIENTIKNNIYNDLLPISKSFTNIKITDYFTDEIVKNFTFSYVKNPDIGTISTEIDKSTNSITWNIPELKSGETANIQYKLKLNNNYDNGIINKVLDTNSKLDIVYTDYSDTTNTKSSNVTPKLKLTENLPTVIPKAGNTIFFGSFGIILVITLIFGIKYFIIKNNMK